jgi:GNAT superfamily N-acetyltransferase
VSTAQHFILCGGIKTCAIGHIDMKNDRAVLRALATDSRFQNQGYGSEMLTLMEKWLKKQGVVCLHTRSLVAAESFYRKRGFTDFPPDFPGAVDRPTEKADKSPCTPTDMGVDWSALWAPSFSTPSIHLVKML